MAVPAAAAAAAPGLDRDANAWEGVSIAMDAGYGSVQLTAATPLPDGTSVTAQMLQRAFVGAFETQFDLPWVHHATEALLRPGCSEFPTGGIARLAFLLDDRTQAIARRHSGYENANTITASEFNAAPHGGRPLFRFMLRHASDDAIARIEQVPMEQWYRNAPGGLERGWMPGVYTGFERERRANKDRASFIVSGIARHMGGTNDGGGDPATLVGQFASATITKANPAPVHRPGAIIRAADAAAQLAAITALFNAGNITAAMRGLKRVHEDLLATANAAGPAPPKPKKDDDEDDDSSSKKQRLGLAARAATRPAW